MKRQLTFITGIAFAVVLLAAVIVALTLFMRGDESTSAAPGNTSTTNQPNSASIRPELTDSRPADSKSPPSRTPQNLLQFGNANQTTHSATSTSPSI